MNDLRCDQLFSSFFYSVDLQFNNQQLIQDCLMLESNYPSVEKSNKWGWQSDYVENYNPIVSLTELGLLIENFANIVSHYEGAGQNLKIENSWININRGYALNVPHTHGSADLIVVYYVQTPEPSAELVLLRTDGAQLCNFTINNPMKTSFALSPVAGRAYAFPSWLTHYVIHESSIMKPRISIAYNLKLSS